MAMSILTNTASLTAQRNLSTTQSKMAGHIGRLSSGLRINSAADDAAGLGISENLKADIRSLAQAGRNANDAVSLGQVAEGAMNEQQGIVSRMRELAVQASNGTLGSTERSYIDTEFDQLSAELNRITNTTEFNGQKLLNGAASSGLTMQVGKENTANDRISMSITKLTTSTLGSSSLHIASVSLSTATNAQKALGAFDKAIEQLSTARAKVGAGQIRRCSSSAAPALESCSRIAPRRPGRLVAGTPRPPRSTAPRRRTRRPARRPGRAIDPVLPRGLPCRDCPRHAPASHLPRP